LTVGVDPGVRIRRRCPLRDVEIDALESGGIVVVDVARRAELEEARIDVRRVLARLAGAAGIGAVAQPLVASSGDLLVAPLDFGLPAMPPHAGVVVGRGTGVGASAVGDRRKVFAGRIVVWARR